MFFIFLGSNECSINNGGCEQLCLPTPDGMVCQCQDGQKIDSSNSSACVGKLIALHFRDMAGMPVCVQWVTLVRITHSEVTKKLDNFCLYGRFWINSKLIVKHQSDLNNQFLRALT